MRLSSRSTDDADVIRARLRTVLEQARRAPGWIPDDDPPDPDAPVELAVADAELPTGVGPPDSPALDTGRHRAPATAVRIDPGRRGVWALVVAGLLAALVLVAWTWWERPRVDTSPARHAAGSAAPSATSVPASPDVGEAAATSGTVVVSVVGRVTRPGLVTLRTGARVADAIAAAGGLLPDADPASVNVAAVVADGQQIAVGVPGAAAGPSVGAAGGSVAAGPVNLNTARAADLDALPGIGPVLAQRIIDYRDQQGRFRTVDQLDDVPGIGPALYARLSGSVTV